MKALFADTFYFLAVLNPRDQNYARVKAFTDTSFAKIITTAWVLVEVGDAFSKAKNRNLFGRLMGILATNADAYVLPCLQVELEAGTNLYLSRPDKDWSLTDCISFEVMKREGVTHALTGDKHFVQAGFTVEFS